MWFSTAPTGSVHWPSRLRSSEAPRAAGKSGAGAGPGSAAAPFLATLAAASAALGVCARAAPAAELHHDTFFVAAGRLYDPNGIEFHIRGVNRLHWDSPSGPGIARSHANTERWDIDFRRPARANVA